FDRVEDWVPGLACARRFPDAAHGEADVERAGLSDCTRHGGHASRAERAEVAPDKAGQEAGGHGGGAWAGRGDGERAEGNEENGCACQHGRRTLRLGMWRHVMIRAAE